MTCGAGKSIFTSQRQAAEVGRRSQHRSYRQGKSVHRIETYHCHDCGGWHVTGHNGHNLNRRNH